MSLIKRRAEIKDKVSFFDKIGAHRLCFHKKMGPLMDEKVGQTHEILDNMRKALTLQIEDSLRPKHKKG